METNLIDIRDFGLSPAKIASRIDSNVAPVVILICHGSRNSVLGLDIPKLREIPNAKVLWIYACECGLSLIHQLADKYEAVLGYATTVLAPATVESTVAFKLKQIIDQFRDELNPRKLIHFVQKKLFLLALEIFKSARTKGNENGLYLVQAALVNHTRLSLRFAGLRLGSAVLESTITG